MMLQEGDKLHIREPVAADYTTVGRLPFRMTAGGEVLPMTEDDHDAAEEWLAQLTDLHPLDIARMPREQFHSLAHLVADLLSGARG